MNTPHHLLSRRDELITVWLRVHTEYFSQVVAKRVPFRYHLIVPSVSERAYRLPAVLQNQ